MLNKIFIMGRLTRDPELRRTQSGTAVTSFSLAVDRDYKSQSGEKETDFIDVVAWRSTAEFVSKYFTKGRMAVVEGRLQIRDWTDKDGNKHWERNDQAVQRAIEYAGVFAIRTGSCHIRLKPCARTARGESLSRISTNSKTESLEHACAAPKAAVSASSLSARWRHRCAS